MTVRVNVGCGASPTPGWLNLDNSISLVLRRVPLLLRALEATRCVSREQAAYARAAKKMDIAWGNSLKLPLPDRSAEVVYSSHMVEHLDREDAAQFLREARRVLVPGGIVRIGVPDLRRLVSRYVDEGDADALVAATLLAQCRPRGVRDRLRWLVAGFRDHGWMYDGPSLCRLLQTAGFVDVGEVSAGHTMISDPGELNLREREDESVFVEARAPDTDLERPLRRPSL